MSVVNRRNAVIGWVALSVGKRIVKTKAKSAVPAIDTKSKRPNKSAIALLFASTVGALMFWKKRSGGGGSGGISDGSGGSEPPDTAS